MLANCYNGKAGVSLSEEARTKDNEGLQCPGQVSLSGLIRLRIEPLGEASHAGIRNGLNAMKRTSKLWCAVVLPKCK